MRTSAAPTFFPVFHGYTDGGIVANNPSIIALSKAIAHYPFLNANNIAVLSLGNPLQLIKQKKTSSFLVSIQYVNDVLIRGDEFFYS